ncbi:flavin reductase family protein [Corticibacter populi]|uniref:flavin reductase family protein n=1 Tax=Corticibacter populi TaxID=1550736 RepID=UPI001F5F7D6C|nr:flavin reductase family protein [Corticibacter populi]
MSKTAGRGRAAEAQPHESGPLGPGDSAARLQADFTTRHLRDALGMYATGVAIVTTLDGQQSPVGLTISSFASVSLEPPLVLWSLEQQSASMPAFAAQQHFAINVLAAHQLPLAQRFASRGVDRFKDLPIVASPSGMPLLPEALAWFECRRQAVHVAGDHRIFIGEVLRTGYQSLPPQEATPLLYHRGRLYQQPLKL